MTSTRYVNPLITLGISIAALVHEKAFGSPENVLKLAESNYRSLAKIYHPDNPDGNSELMSTFSRAIEELRDKEALKFYVDELISEQDVDEFYRYQQYQQLVSRDDKAIARLVRGYSYINQFHPLGITKPTSFIADFYFQRVVIDVLSPYKSVARVTGLDDRTDNHAGLCNHEVVYRRGVWREAYVDQSQRKRWISHNTFISTEQVKLIGFVDESSYIRNTQPSNKMRSSYELESNHELLAWDFPQNCWFLPKLVFARDRPQQISGLVLYKKGLFAITNELLGTSLIKTE